MPASIRQILLSLLLLFFTFRLPAQEHHKHPLFQRADSLDPVRFWLAIGTGTSAYGATTIGLWQIWYKGYDQTGFHTFNDSGEWMAMDKLGHLFTTHFESNLSYQLLRWTGVKHQRAVWMGIGFGMLFQTTVEVMDGFSAKWGFSWADMGFNTLGAGFFAGQELLWKEQRIWLKMSNTLPAYPVNPVFSENEAAITTPRQRARELFGTSFAETFMKDYNGQTIWFSVNPRSFMGKRKAGASFPAWLNIAVGYGAENMYGGFENKWADAKGNTFSLGTAAFPRYRQFYISPDIDPTRIATRSLFLRALLNGLSFIKFPAPALEVTSRGKIKFHPLFW